MIYIIASFIIIAIGILLNSISVPIVLTLFFLIGHFLLYFFSDDNNLRSYLKIFNITFLVYAIYAFACRLYMEVHGYNYLLTFDSINAYYPAAQHFMRIDSISQMIHEIYNSSFNQYKHLGIISIYFAYIGKFASIFDNELYYNLQASIFFLTSFVSVFVSKLLKEHDVEEYESITFIYAFGSIIAYYATPILRDVPIYLSFVIVFCYSMQDLNLRNITIIIICILVTFYIRPQHAIFLTIYGIIIFLNRYHDTKSVVFFFAIVGIIIYANNKLNVIDIYENTMENSEKRLTVGAAESTLNKLDQLPWGISHILKIIFIHISPIPSWDHFKIGLSSNAVRNIMNFPIIYAVLYNFCILGTILYGLIFRVFKIDLKMKIILILTVLFLFLQSNSTEQRRIVACYPILLLYSSLIFQNLDKTRRTQLLQYIIIGFAFVQIIGILKYL